MGPGWRLLTSQPGFRHVVGLVVDPLGTVRPDVGLGGGVSHRVVADPSGQVGVESAGVNDAVCIHQAPFCQLQNGKNRGLSGVGLGTKRGRALYQHLQRRLECPWSASVEKIPSEHPGFLSKCADQRRQKLECL